MWLESPYSPRLIGLPLRARNDMLIIGLPNAWRWISVNITSGLVVISAPVPLMGGTYEINDSNLFTGAIYAIATGGAKLLAVDEGT